MTKDVNFNFGGLWEKIQPQLKARGIDIDFDFGEGIDFGEGFDFSCAGKDGQGARVKVVCVAPDLKESVEEMGQTQRDQVVMVRVDESTLENLDAWVATGAVKSRSEAAALFIREGLKVRADELEKLRDALREVQEAKERLQQQAREIFGASEPKPTA